MRILIVDRGRGTVRIGYYFVGVEHLDFVAIKARNTPLCRVLALTLFSGVGAAHSTGVWAIAEHWSVRT